MSLTAKQVEEAVSEFEGSSDYESEVDGDIYGDLHYFASYDKKKTLEVPGLPTLKPVEAYGGEGEGDDYWVVFQCGDQYFRKDGWYASYDGGYLDGELYEVKPKQVTVTEFQKI